MEITDYRGTRTIPPRGRQPQGRTVLFDSARARRVCDVCGHPTMFAIISIKEGMVGANYASLCRACTQEAINFVKARQESVPHRGEGPGGMA